MAWPKNDIIAYLKFLRNNLKLIKSHDNTQHHEDLLNNIFKQLLVSDIP